MEQMTQDTTFKGMVPELQEELQQENQPQKKKAKGKETLHKTLIRVIIALVILAVGIFLVLFLVAKASHFDSIGSMLQHMFVELSLMWQRITA